MSVNEWADLLGNVGEFVGAIAVVVTLTFLAIQIRQSNQAARTAAESEDPQRLAEWHARVSAQSENRRIWDAAAEDFGSLDPEEVRRFRWIVAELQLVFESSYYAYRGGLLSEPSWAVKRDTILGLLQNPIIQDQWDRRQTPFSEEFRQEIEAHRGRSDLMWKHQLVSEIAGENDEATFPGSIPPGTKD